MAAALRRPHGADARRRWDAGFAANVVSGVRAHRLLDRLPWMRLLVFAALVYLAIVPAALAGPRACGDDVDGHGTAVPCRCGDVLVSGRTLADEDAVTQAPCDGTAL